MRRYILFTIILLLIQPAMAQEPGLTTTEPELNEESGQPTEQPSVSFDQQDETGSEQPEVPLDPVTKRFLMMDTDENATVSREEYIDAALTRAAERFDKIDTNGDGEATPEEYHAFRRSNRDWWMQRFRMELKPETGE